MASTSLPQRTPRYFTPGQVAAWAGVTSMTIIRWCDQGVLKAVTTPGGHRRIFEASVRDYLDARGLPIPPQVDARPSAGSHVVLVDDEPRAMRALAGRLRKFVDVTTYSDGYRALVAACATPPEALVLDMHMPELSGEKVIRALRHEPRTAKMVIVARSDENVMLDAALRAGADYAFAKDGLDDVEKILYEIAHPRTRRAPRRQT